jgi:hypothetical protein
MSGLTNLLAGDVNSLVVSMLSAAGLTLLPWLRDRVLPRGPRLVYYQTKPTAVVLNQHFVQTETLFIQNVGGREATDVCVIHNWPAGTFEAEVEPRNYTPDKTPSGEAVFKLAPIHKGETCIVTYVCRTPPSRERLVNSVRGHDHTARRVEPPTVQKYPSWFQWIVNVLAFLGAWLVLALLIDGALMISRLII